jgi:hypothetical protein
MSAPALWLLWFEPQQRWSTAGTQVESAAAAAPLARQEKKPAALSIPRPVARRASQRPSRYRSRRPERLPRPPRRTNMRFIVMHKADKNSESGTPPPQELINGMGKLIGETARAGMFLAGEGLKPSSTRLRLTFARGQRTVTRGPYAGSNELPAGFVILKVKSTEDAIEWASQLAAAAGDAEIELGPLVEPWDLGMVPKPKSDVPLRFLLLRKATPQSEAGTPPTPKQKAETERVLADMTRAGVLALNETLLPSASGTRLRYRDNQRTVSDGPFTESKELVGGFSLVQMRTLEEVLEWSNRFVRIIGGTCEIDVRPVAEAKG